MLDDSTIRAALLRTGQNLTVSRSVEIVLLGGAAAVLTGQLPGTWTTGDVDLLACQRPEDRDAVLDAAAQAARELGLPPSWLSEDAGLFAWAVPDGWPRRRVSVGTFGRLRVFAISRLDLIATKFAAHREGDLEHLREMRVQAAELAQVRELLQQLRRQHPEEAARIELALRYLDSWECA